MGNLQTTTLLLGIGLAVLILFLVRRDHLYLPHGLFWMVVAAAAALFGVWPRLIDQVAAWVGVVYPPAFLFLCVGVILFVKALHADMVNTRIERQLRRLNQMVSMMASEKHAGHRLGSEEGDSLPSRHS